MATKEQERAELHRTIWQIANELRGSVDGWDFKSYVLGMLFYRFISENLAKFINDGERIAQMIIAKHEQPQLVEVEVLDETERGAGGFGHTGR